MEKNEFEKKSLLLFVLMMGSNICNYLFQVITGRMMDVSDYGTLNSLLSIITIFSTPGTIITMVTARYVSIGKANADKSRMFGAFYYTMKITLILIGGIIITGVFLSSQIARVLQISNVFYIFICLLVSSIFLLNAPLNGTVQGMQFFLKYGLQTSMPSFFKLIIGVVLIRAGFHVWGALGGLMIGNIIANAYAVYSVKSLFGRKIFPRDKRTIKFADLWEFVSGTTISQLCITVVSNGDILLVKVFFSGKEAGIYSSGMVIGKIAMYLSAAVVATLFPIIAERHEKGIETITLFSKALFYGGGASILCSFFMSWFGNMIVGVMFGERYQESISFLPFIGFYIVPVTILMIIMNYVLAKSKAKLFSITMLLGIIGIILIAMFVHSSLKIMILGMGLIMWLVVIINLLEIYAEKKAVYPKA